MESCSVSTTVLVSLGGAFFILVVGRVAGAYIDAATARLRDAKAAYLRESAT
jgi:hypothetical protein